MSTTVRALRDAGVDASGVAVWGASPVRDDTGIRRISGAASRRSVRWVVDTAPRIPALAAAIRRAELVHWYMSAALPGGLDIRLAARLGKPSIAEFAGGEIRNPEIEVRDNPYYAEVLPEYEYRRWETAEASRRTQALFAAHGSEALVSCPSLLAYIEPGRFEHVHLVRQRVAVGELTPTYPNPEQPRPLVVHASTARVAKGTPWVLDAIEQLRRHLDFEFVLLEGVSRQAALETIGRADVYLDQFVVGAHGGAAVEAMALGTPVIGYVKPAVAAAYPPELPLVNATRETLVDVLGNLLGDGARRNALGRRSREYAERHHDARRLANELRDVYEQAIARRTTPT
jgi:hypothetical protein